MQALAAQEIQRGVQEIVDRGFTSKTDPYGKAWQPPKSGGETMERTGALRKGFRVLVAKGTGFGFSLQIVNAQEYASWLQEGTSLMVPRKTVPDMKIPAEYDKLFRSAYEHAFDKWFSSLNRQ